MLNSLSKVSQHVDLDQLANPNLTYSSVSDQLVGQIPCPVQLLRSRDEAAFRISMRMLVQVLMLVAPVLKQWKAISFSQAFDAPRRTRERMIDVSQTMMQVMGVHEYAKSARMEMLYRDYIVRRNSSIPVGTLLREGSLQVELEDMFVMPQVRSIVVHSDNREDGEQETSEPKKARSGNGRVRSRETDESEGANDSERVDAIAAIQTAKHHLLVGAPGSGKSTFLEWLQLQIASDRFGWTSEGRQVIPLLLQARELNLTALPEGKLLFEAATSNSEWSDLISEAWVQERLQMGQLFLMVDGLDEIDAGMRETKLVPWLSSFITSHPKCPVIVTSRPMEVQLKAFRELKFKNFEIVPFSLDQILEFVKRWYTATRLSQGDTQSKATERGDAEGQAIFESLTQSEATLALAANPLMLSAACLLYAYENGKLPENVPRLYELCVDGLLHIWDKHRGIESEFPYEEKLTASMEVALAMQAADRAEFSHEEIIAVLSPCFPDEGKSLRMLDHMKQRSGLLLEMRQGVFAFVHLSFQEYLASRAIHQGNSQDIGEGDLIENCAEPNWFEVIVLYSRIITGNKREELVAALVMRPPSHSLAALLTRILSASDIALPEALLAKAITVVASAPEPLNREGYLESFQEAVVRPIANMLVGHIDPEDGLSSAFRWLLTEGERVDLKRLVSTLSDYESLPPGGLTEASFLLHRFGSQRHLSKLAAASMLYAGDAGLRSKTRPLISYTIQAEVALEALSARRTRMVGDLWPQGTSRAVCAIAAALSSEQIESIQSMRYFEVLIGKYGVRRLSCEGADLTEFARNLESIAAQSSQEWPEIIMKWLAIHQ